MPVEPFPNLQYLLLKVSCSINVRSYIYARRVHPRNPTDHQIRFCSERNITKEAQHRSRVPKERSERDIKYSLWQYYSNERKTKNNIPRARIPSEDVTKLWAAPEVFVAVVDPLALLTPTEDVNVSIGPKEMDAVAN
jgi:hypothetical protein